MHYLWRNPYSVLLIIACVLTGCATQRERSSESLIKLAATDRRCSPPSIVKLTMDRHSLDQGRTRTRPDSASELAPGSFSPQALEIAETIGAKDLLVRIQTLKTDHAQATEGIIAIRLLRLRQQLSDRIVLASLDVARTAAEADCEEERADQLADRLQEVRDRKIRYRTLVAIVGDALVGVMAGGFGLALQETASEVSAIFGGGLATIFGFAAAFTGEEHEFWHPRNLLKEIWEGPQHSTLMPESVWRFLNRPLIGDPEQRSFRETLIMQWHEDGRLGAPASDTEQRRIALLFGEGGIYEIEDLRARASMLDLLEAEVNLMSEHLQLLMKEVLTHDLDQ